MRILSLCFITVLLFLGFTTAGFSFSLSDSSKKARTLAGAFIALFDVLTFPSLSETAVLFRSRLRLRLFRCILEQMSIFSNIFALIITDRFRQRLISMRFMIGLHCFQCSLRLLALHHCKSRTRAFCVGSYRRCSSWLLRYLGSCSLDCEMRKQHFWLQLKRRLIVHSLNKWRCWMLLRQQWAILQQNQLKYTKYIIYSLVNSIKTSVSCRVLKCHCLKIHCCYFQSSL